MPRGKSEANLRLIAIARDALQEIQPTTVRGVAYQLFMRRVIPSMGREHNKRVSQQLTDARERGWIDWDWIVDLTREPEHVTQYADLADFADDVEHWYRHDRWQTQPRQIEVWSEKDTVGGVLRPVLNRFGVSFRVFHGFGSATSVHDVAVLTRGWRDPLLAFYVGDWDPSGLWMSERDLPERLARYGGRVEIRRLAISPLDTTPDVPSFAAAERLKDARYPWFAANYGDRCWEVDALNPNVLRTRVEQAIDAEIDHAAWDRAERVEQAEREVVLQFTKQLRRLA